MEQKLKRYLRPKDIIDAPLKHLSVKHPILDISSAPKSPHPWIELQALHRHARDLVALSVPDRAAAQGQVLEQIERVIFVFFFFGGGGWMFVFFSFFFGGGGVAKKGIERWT